MNNMKTIQIFLASSIKEFEREREQLELFIRNVSDHFETKYKIKIRIVLCENIDPSYTAERKQEEYNNIIRECEMVFFIFFTKLGEFTYEEFLVAKKQFEEFGKPKIYTYFKNLSSSETMEQSLVNFMSWLDNSLGHYHTNFDHLDTIKLRMLLSIRTQELDFAEISIKNGQCCVNSIPVVSLNKVSEFYNNTSLQELLDSYKEQEAECKRLKSLYIANPQDKNICSEYAQVCAKQETLSQEIQKLQEYIFRTTLNICNLQVNGTITNRQKEAYQLFEQGDLEGCMRILDSEDIDREYHSGEKMLEKLAKDNAVKYIREHMIAIDILSSMVNNPHRYMEIAERYEKIIPVAKKYFVEKDVFFSYCNFLSDSGQRWNAKKFIEELVAFYKANSEHFTPKEFAQVYVLYGDVYAKMNIYSDAGRAYRKALKQLKKEPEENAYKMVLTEKLTQSVLEVGKRYRSHYVYECGNISYRLSAVNLLFRCIQKKYVCRLDAASTVLLEKDVSDANRLLRARVHYDYARYYEKHNNKRSFAHYQKALEIAESCDDSEAFVEQCLQSIVIFLWHIYPRADISPYLDRLIQIREKQFLDNPDKYFFALYVIYLIACYKCRDDDKSTFEKYGNKLQQIVLAFESRMKSLADADAQSYMRLSDGSLDWFLNELAYDHPEIFPLINNVYYKFQNPNLMRF